MLIGRYRRYGVIAAASIGGSLAFVFVFMRIVYVSLPLGVGAFQKLSLWLLATLGVR
jgi:putative tricarboxylic transport membrane protein